ncbi:hypothetical protein [Neorhodopirellula pilleata]|uniref:DUF4350 domain-containing protein n=1 Tax=Neorhodopirellula pilleata TaxID=2714738 RepID=A0A5C6APN4_9BACT|nr:hypothetical protein [Neorhodopirellula pilleata]TWU01983.1 hypothetical protein Pla100_17190 [Neorhodopirellula pilleata]
MKSNDCPVRIPQGFQALFVLICLTCLGCSGFITEYGESDGVQGNQSLNGFGAFRNAIGQSETAPEVTINTRDLSRLSSRAERFDTLVWIPKAWPPANEAAVTTWLNRWLRKGQKSIVFVVPDGGSTEAYFREAASVAPPQQRLEYRRRLANLINERLLEDGQRRDVRLGDWFVAEALPYRQILSDRRIADYDLSEVPDRESSASGQDLNDDSIDIGEIEMVDIDDEQLLAEIDELLDMADDEAELPAEIVDPIQFESLGQETTPRSGNRKLLTTLARITDSRWADSQILVVASGGLITNYAMTAAPANELANEISDSISRTAKANDNEGKKIEIAFLSSDEGPVPVSNLQPGAPVATGMELLTTWPLSLVTMHGVFLGVVMCLMLLPVFGRARQVTYNRTTHFGNHLSAMAALMRRSDRNVNGTLFARTKISQYLKVVRGETSGPWVMPESKDKN